MIKPIRQAFVTAALAAASGSVLAAPPTGFSYDDYTVNAGAITASCPVGYTCTNLDASGNGILQQRITDGVESYFRTIVLDQGVTAADLAAVEALGFRSESYVSAEDTGSYAARNIVQADGPLAIITNTSGEVLATDAVYTYAEVMGGDLSIGGPVILEQRNDLTGTVAAGVNRFVEFKANGPSNNMNMQINAVQPNNEGNITIRKATATAGGTLVLTDADASIPALAYSANDRLQVVWLEQAASGAGDAFNRMLGQQIYTNLTTGAEISYSNADGLGNFIGVNTGTGNEVGGIGPWNWNASLFGSEPNPYLVNAAGTGIVQPATTFP
jgi:hypothetical protein